MPTTPLEAIGATPLVELESVRPEGGARILAKWEGANPTGSMKDRMARAMIEGAEREGLLSPGQRVVEYTGGSTGSSLAFVCAARGYDLTLLTADCFSREKIQTMQALGADVEVFETPEGKVHPGLVDAWRDRVDELVDETGAYWTHQMDNPHQLDGYDAMADEIASALPGDAHEHGLDLAMTVGTGGCAMGTSRGFQRREIPARVTLGEPAEAPYLTQGEGGSHGVEGIAVQTDPPLLDADLYDRALAVPEKEARAAARRLARREGLLVGVSSGLNLALAGRIASRRDPGDLVVTVLVDTGLKYLDGDLFATP